MIRPLSAPSKRIVVALAVSLLLHGWILLGTNIRLPRFPSSLPPLQARLEPLPSAPDKPQPQKKNPSQPRVAPGIKLHSASALAENLPPAETLPLALPLAVLPGERPLLPRKAQLTFAVTMGASKLEVGETIHTLQAVDGRYELQSVTRTMGIASMFKSFELTQTSSGDYSRESGLQPRQFVEERTELGNTKTTVVGFDFQTGRASYSQGGELSFPLDMQDSLSVLYQFPPLANTEIVSVPIGSSENIEAMQFEIINNETITTPFGKLLTVHLRKMHPANEAGWEIWLAREYRLFPVKMRIIETNGKVASETVITDIRVEDAPQEK
ncbi:MAG: DUF3108 domain-containing protein [Sideroxydans sp.]|nr:DUF3108 domain-containing protein [Sideroxydans sp.]